ncbi:hypothetical protein JVT61DRAFT_10897 [Boletus reticuloceps]|uniref:Uncharacterized protein n=1 Tax=Boletus reticuloceps TaxID=495285 RepID=A0A8I2YFB9_9AGAM|nr:hypothetical protein JVT61DRAFT_10897 [Boletus reticuloceps]
MRPLTLHVSALSDTEYDLYMASLNDLVTDSDTNVQSTNVRDDAHYERTSVGVREVRAWLRGRYSSLLASDIDSILKFFCPNMLPSDTLTGGQFFAALRLVIHAGSGKGVDRTLAFVQASPRLVKAPDVPPPLSPPKRPVQAPPSHPDRQKPPPLITSSPETNPFTRKSMDHVHGAPPMPPSDSELAPVHLLSRPSKMSHNPFLARDPGMDKTVPPAHALNQGKLPPLPPRKPTSLAAPLRWSSEVVPTPINLMLPSGPPLIPVKPTHVMSPLMKQSLEASKHAQSMKRAEEQLDRERVLQVLKTTSSSSSSASNTTPSMRTRSLSPSKHFQKQFNGHAAGSASGGSDDATCVPPLPRRRKPSLPSSTSSSVLSLEQVASAALPSPTAAPSRPPLPSRDVAGPGSVPPPTHPRRRPSTSTEPTVNDSQSSSPSSPRVARSRSVTSSSSALPPPPRRKRPESMQLTPTSDGGDLGPFPLIHSAHVRTASSQGLSRHLSLTRNRERDPSDSSPMANFQKTLSQFQLKAQPKLDAVRYKAEAGISKRGYVHHAHLGGTRWREEGEQGLMADTRWSATDVDRDPDSEPTTDDEPSSGEDQVARRTRGAAPYRDSLTESDNLKWPMGEGWKPL